PVEATVGIAYDEARNGFTYSVDYAYDYQQYYEDQSRDLWIAPHWTDAQRFHQGGSRALTSDPGIQAKYGISYENLYYYQGQIALLDSLRSRASGVLSRALSENQNLLYGSGNEEGLFTDNGNPQDLYFRTADEWEVRRLTQELAQAREREDRKRAVIQAVSNRDNSFGTCDSLEQSNVAQVNDKGVNSFPRQIFVNTQLYTLVRDY
ncbi:MAG: hypothetical protein J0L74_11705, partial [Burkholderiales bacterium]|nr:hypothetical protein [Burkholderiales bacterium]